jgi:hypothetical protein
MSSFVARQRHCVNSFFCGTCVNMKPYKACHSFLIPAIPLPLLSDITNTKLYMRTIRFAGFKCSASANAYVGPFYFYKHRLQSANMVGRTLWRPWLPTISTLSEGELIPKLWARIEKIV